jgi:hypothetical protein
MQAPSFKNKDVQALFEAVQSRDPDQPEFLQAVEEVLQTMEPVFEKHPEYALPTPTSLFSMILTSTFWHDTSCTIFRMLSFHCQLAGVDVVQGHTQALRLHAPWLQCRVPYILHQSPVAQAMSTLHDLHMSGAAAGLSSRRLELHLL